MLIKFIQENKKSIFIDIFMPIVIVVIILIILKSKDFLFAIGLALTYSFGKLLSRYHEYNKK